MVECMAHPAFVVAQTQHCCDVEKLADNQDTSKRKKFVSRADVDENARSSVARHQVSTVTTVSFTVKDQ